MTASAHDSPTALDLTNEEAWALHAALLASVEDAVEEGETPEPAVTLLDRVEEDDDFETVELAFFAEVLREYVDGRAPSRDRRPARSVIDDIEAALA